MSDPKLMKSCAGGCGVEVEISEREAKLRKTYPLKWWCPPCSDRVVDEALLDPILFSLARQPHLRAKLREILEME